MRSALEWATTNESCVSFGLQQLAHAWTRRRWWWTYRAISGLPGGYDYVAASAHTGRTVQPTVAWTLNECYDRGECGVVSDPVWQ